MLRPAAGLRVCPMVVHRSDSGAPNGGDIVSDRALRLHEWCPTCRAAPGARCRMPSFSRTSPPTPLHVARGWRARTCPTCKAPGGSMPHPSGRQASHMHQARLDQGGTSSMPSDSVWQELKARSVTTASVPSSGRAGRGGHVDRITVSRLDDDKLDVQRWTSRDELAMRSRGRSGIAGCVSARRGEEFGGWHLDVGRAE